jgi:hypothetical protein
MAELQKFALIGFGEAGSILGERIWPQQVATWSCMTSCWTRPSLSSPFAWLELMDAVAEDK